jgi:alanine racemase
MSPTSAPGDSRLTVDLDALGANYGTLRHQAGAAEAAPVVKADGYGLGAVQVARRLAADGAQTFFVARIGEGVTLRRAMGAGARIFVLDGCPEGAAPTLTDAALTPVLNTPEQIEAWRGAGGTDAALMLDTGLNRLGLTLEAARETACMDGFAPAWVMSHLACADQPSHPMNAAQNARFREMAALFPNARRSLAASDGLFLGPAFAFDMVRTGICLYGGGPEGRPDPRIRAVATFEAPILQLRLLETGQTVGYGAAFTATRATSVAIVAAGYADGVLRAASPNAYGSLNGRRCAVLGRISMDLTAYDVTGCDDARPGAMMQIIGPDVPVDDAAAAARTIAYELLTRIGARATRVYRGER